MLRTLMSWKNSLVSAGLETARSEYVTARPPRPAGILIITLKTRDIFRTGGLFSQIKHS